jgi:heat shock protein HslJ
MRMRTPLILLLGCLAASAAVAQSTITAADLQHHRWVLETIDGEPLPATEGNGKVPELDFGEQMTVTGNLGCNQFNGTAVLRDGYFLIEAMATARMMCAPPWDDIERKVQTVLSSESTPSIGDDGYLTLESASTVLLFRPADWVAAASTSAEATDHQARGLSQTGSRRGFTQNPPRFGGPTSPAGEIHEADEEMEQLEASPERRAWLRAVRALLDAFSASQRCHRRPGQGNLRGLACDGPVDAERPRYAELRPA